jgi:[histone H3]-trimethyl-L-lysine4 demethylase
MDASPPPANARGSASLRGKSPRSAVAAARRPHPPLSSSPEPGTSEMAATITSCLSIPVEGSVPIVPPDEPRLNPTSAQNGPAPSRRAPRQSKTDALAAMRSQADSDSNDASPSATQFPIKPETAPISPPLDLSTVRTTSPRHPPPRRAPRPFGLEDCPTYHPSAEEFKDPMAYVQSISEEGMLYGMCKIVPPEGWKMPFVTDTEVSASRAHQR